MISTKYKRVVHLIPKDGIGGVEIAASSLSSGKYNNIEFIKYFISKPEFLINSTDNNINGKYSNIYDFRNHINFFYWIYKKKPDLLISSIWISHFLGSIYKLFNQKCIYVCFLHSSKPMNLFDNFFSLLAIYFSDAIFTDSVSTMEARLTKSKRLKSKIISYILATKRSSSNFQEFDRFIYWGRYRKQKGIEDSLLLFQLISRERPNAVFHLYGPDNGNLAELKKLRKSLGLEKKVTFFSERTREELDLLARDYSFFLQTSPSEGFSISIAESMQLGLIPVTTNVGEIQYYCKHMINSVIINGFNDTVKDLMYLSKNPKLLSQIRMNSINTWTGSVLYRDDILLKCNDLLNI